MRRQPREGARDGVVLARRLFIVLTILAALLVALGPALRLQAAILRQADPTHSAVLPTMFDVNTEGNMPSWFAASLWMTAALLAGVCAFVAVQRRTQWLLLAVICLVMSIDEGAGFHERVLGAIGGGMLGTERSSLLHFAWVVPGVLVALVIVGSCARLIWSLPSSQRAAIVLSGAVFLSGALVMESLSGFALSNSGDGTWYVITTSLEEGLEKVAVILFLCTLVSLIEVDRQGGRTLLVLTGQPDAR